MNRRSDVIPEVREKHHIKVTNTEHLTLLLRNGFKKMAFHTKHYTHAVKYFEHGLRIKSRIFGMRTLGVAFEHICIQKVLNRHL
jgi:helix-turn-helix protein